MEKLISEAQEDHDRAEAHFSTYTWRTDHTREVDGVELQYGYWHDEDGNQVDINDLLDLIPGAELDRVKHTLSIVTKE